MKMTSRRPSRTLYKTSSRTSSSASRTSRRARRSTPGTEAEKRTSDKAPTKKAFVDGRIKDVPLYNPNKKAYVDPPQSGYLNFMSRQTEVEERAATQTLKLRETALVRREGDEEADDARRNEVKERERRQELEDERRERREERLEREEERKERLLEIHERNKEKREERAERAKEARARRREAFLRAADEEDDGASLDAIEQEIETRKRLDTGGAREGRRETKTRRRTSGRPESGARSSTEQVEPSDWAEFLGRREEAIERRTTRDPWLYGRRLYNLRARDYGGRRARWLKLRSGKEQKALEQRRERLEKKREHAEELRDKVLSAARRSNEKRVEKAERAAAIEQRERDEDYDDDGSLGILGWDRRADHALEDIREEREKRAVRKAKVKEERRVEER